jgi:hypothetical protein
VSTSIEAVFSKMVYNEQRNVGEKCDDVAKILPGWQGRKMLT